MANKIKGINIKIGADTTGLDTALKNIENSGKNAKSELNEIKRAINQNKDSVVLWQQKQEVLTKVIENSKEKTNLLLQAQKGIEQAFRDGDIDRQAYDKFKEKLQKSTDKLKDLKSQQADFEQKFQSGEIDKDAYDKFIDKIQKAEREVQGLENSQRSMEENLRLETVSEEQYRAFQREIEKSKDQTRNFENQLSEATNRIDELGNHSDDTAEDVDELGDEMQEAGEQAENSANGGYTVLGNVFANIITKGIELAWTALKNFTKYVVATGTEYESAISNVVAISGAMAEEVELLQSKAEEMGATTKFTATESAEAMSYMAMAGWKVNDMVSGLDGIMDLSAASGESLASVSDIVTDALTAFGLTAGDSAHFADVLAAASSNANTNVAMMGETFKYAAPVAGSFGFSIEDTAEAIGLMANSGIKASQAGTSLRRILTEMSHDIQLDGEKIHQFTVKTSNADGSMRNLSDILGDLRVGWEQLSESEQAANATAIVGTNAMSGFLALMNSAPADVEKLSTAIENADGTAKDMAETMLDNLQGDKTLLDSAFDGVKIAISKELNPALREITQWATQQMPKFQAVIEPLFKSAVNGVKSLINGFEKIKPVLSAVKPLIITIFANEAIHLFTKTLLPKALELLGKIPSPLALITKPIEIISKTPQMLTGLLDKIKTVPSLLANVGTAFKGLWAVISANPYATAFVAATTAGLAVKSYIDNIEIEKTEVELLIEKHNEELQLLADKRQAIKDLNNAFYENVDSIQYQTDRTKDLWLELDKLTDQYGNVQQKDQARAEYILNELNNALGTEYTMTGHQIDNYRILSAEIDNVIAKKQAEMMLDAYLANSTEMTQQRIEARTDYENADKEYNEKKKVVDDLEYKYKELTGNSADEITRDERKSTATDQIRNMVYSKYNDNYEIEDLANQIWTARNETMQAQTLRLNAKRNYEATSEYFEKQDQLYEFYSLGQYDRMAEIIYAEKDLTSTTLDETATDAEQRLQIYNDSLEKILSHFQLNSEKMSQTAVDELGKELEVVMKNAALTEEDKNKVWEENFKGYLEEYLEKGYDILPMISFADDLDMSPADLFGDKWREDIQKQRENGHDITELLQLAIKNDYQPEITFRGADNFNDYLWERLTNGQDIEYLLDWGFSKGKEDIINSNEFQDAYRETIQQHLEKGLEVDGLLKWSDKANLAGSEEFVDVFKKTVANKLQNNEAVGSLLEWGNTLGIDMGDIFGARFAEQMETLHANDADLTDFIKWAEANGNKVGEIFGENFQETLDQFLALPTEEVKISNPHDDDILTKNLTNYYKKGQNLSNLSKKAIEQGKNIRDVFGDDFMKVIQKQLNKGYDVTNLVKWAESSGEEISEDFLDIYTETVQNGIDKGYDITQLLKWGEKSGFFTGDMLGKHYTDKVQKFVDDGFSISALIEWAIINGKKIGEIFGENFRNIANDYINDRQEKFEYIQQELTNSSHIGNFFFGNRKMKFMADGGFLSHGQAVVAEAGPELLEVMNGGVRVTPLTQNSRNTAVSGNSNISYNYYTVNANISNSYDVYKLAEELATAKNRIERGLAK